MKLLSSRVKTDRRKYFAERVINIWQALVSSQFQCKKVKIPDESIISLSLAITSYHQREASITGVHAVSDFCPCHSLRKKFKRDRLSGM